MHLPTKISDFFAKRTVRQHLEAKGQKIVTLGPVFHTKCRDRSGEVRTVLYAVVNPKKGGKVLQGSELLWPRKHH